MAEAAPGEGLSKSAKRRAAARRAKEVEGAAESAPAPVIVQPPAAPKAAAKPAAKPKAKAAVAEPPAPVPKAPVPQPKAKAKATAAEPLPPATVPKAAPKPEAAPKASAAPKLAAKQQPAGKAKAKAAAKAVEEEEEVVVPKSKDELVNWTIDDGSGGGWETAAGVSKKMQKQREKKKDEAQAKAYALSAYGTQHIPGMGQHIPGMGPVMDAKSKAAASQAVNADVARILALKCEAPVKEDAPAANVSSASVKVPEKRIGMVIGPKGATLKMITEKTGVSRIDTTGDMFTITGNPTAVAKAETALNEIVEKGYCSLAYDDFSENFVNVNPQYFPDLIGKEGAVVRAIKDALKVEVAFPAVPPKTVGSKKYKVTLAGSAVSVEKAKATINNIIMFGHDEITHPGQVHEELEVEDWMRAFIIGPKGSELKHIEKNWKVRVFIPRENSVNDKVVVVGEPLSVERAKAYIERLLAGAETSARGGRDKVEATDVWGDDDDFEDWMTPYMYRR